MHLKMAVPSFFKAEIVDKSLKRQYDMRQSFTVWVDNFSAVKDIGG